VRDGGNTRPGLLGAAVDVDARQRLPGPLEPDDALDRLARAGDIVEGRPMERMELRLDLGVAPARPGPGRRRGEAGHRPQAAALDPGSFELQHDDPIAASPIDPEPAVRAGRGRLPGPL